MTGACLMTYYYSTGVFPDEKALRGEQEKNALPQAYPGGTFWWRITAFCPSGLCVIVPLWRVCVFSIIVVQPLLAGNPGPLSDVLRFFVQSQCRVMVWLLVRWRKAILYAVRLILLDVTRDIILALDGHFTC